ncbi:hypothetical protein KUTeg_000608 [Tegillarca granosa]|uniref:Uncharacterized protein n=1 Tax=Tegillarca granosa TaxID=220873 RepID=A0ABQ9G1F9_TEGGR|nr:hypothetical protein KUTeg_000608 [Tegillarca granosa]
MFREMSGNKVLASNEKVTVLSNPTLPVSTVSSLVTNDSTTDGHDILNLNLEGFEDKNPFSGFSEEHLSKLDEFLSSEEARKILKETSEDDFSPAMAEIDDTEVGGLGNEAANSGGDSLMFDNESKSGGGATHIAATFSDHAYAMPMDRAPKAQSGSSLVKQSPTTFTMTTIASPGVTTATTQTVVPAMPEATTSAVKSSASKAGSSNQVTKVAITLATASPSASPRKSTRIALRKGAITAKEEEDQEMTEEVKQEETTQENPEQGNSGKNTGTPKGKDKGKGKKEVVAEDKPSPTPSRRSTRIGEIEQRELAEKIRQENLQKEKEEMQSLKTKGNKVKEEVPTESVVEKKGKKRGPKKKDQANETKEEDMEVDEEEEEEEESEDETEMKSAKKNKKQKAKGKKTQKGKKQKNKKAEKPAEKESENEEEDGKDDDEEEGDEDDENEEEEEDKPLKPGKKGLKKVTLY